MDAQLIVIIVALALSVLSGLNKNKKKKAEKQYQGGGHSSPVEDGDDPWATIRRYIEDAREEEFHHPEPMPVEGGRTTVDHLHEPVQRENPYTATLNEYVNRKAAERLEHKSTNTRITSAPREDMIELADEDNIMEDFDLRKAVIYSEILTPKYEKF